MKLLYVVLPALAASAKPVYYARLGEFCGQADNGDYHACHGDLTCHSAQCVKGYATGHLRGYHSYPVHYKHPYYSGAHYQGHPYYPKYPGHVAYPRPCLGSTGDLERSNTVAVKDPLNRVVFRPFVPGLGIPYDAFPTSTAWASVKAEDYTAEGQPCSGITGLGAGQKPCAPWLACYKQTSTGSFFGRAYGGYYGTAQNGICKAKLVHLGQRCGRSKSSHAEINMGRCPAWSHCQPDVGFVDHMQGGELLGEGICTQTPIERLEDFVDPFHSSLT